MSTEGLPEPAHADIDSMLGRKFGKEVANYFAGSTLNRVSFLRTDHEFLSAALTHPKALFLLYKDLQPLIDKKLDLAFLPFTDVKTLVDADTFKDAEEERIKRFNSSITSPPLTFLGIEETQTDSLQYKIYKGTPYWALDVTPKGTIKEAAEALIKSLNERELDFDKRYMNLAIPAGEAAVFGQGRANLDWNARNPFCASCGQKTMSTNAGYKRICPKVDNGIEREPCPTREGLHNIAFPRTDPTVIMAIISADGTKILVGRGKRYPPNWYSTLAGFCEQSESVEDAVRREVWEESGVVVGRVVIHSTQPWPFPANLMIGAIGQALPGKEDIKLDYDPELEDAKWVTLDEVREALKHGTSGIGEGPPPEYKEGGLRLPPPTAIAYQLLHAVVSGWAGNLAGPKM